MGDRYEKIRWALAMGPTPESWAQDIDGDAAYAMFCCQSAAEAAFITACDPDTIRALLDERDALAAENERLTKALLELEEREQRDEDLLRQALDALSWTTGSQDFSEGGLAREGALKLLFPTIAALRERLCKQEQRAAFRRVLAVNTLL